MYSYNESGEQFHCIANRSILYLLFDLESASDTNIQTLADKCATLGIEPIFVNDAEKQLRQCKSPILVRTRNQEQRDKAAGVLKGIFSSLYFGSIRLGREKFI